MANTFKFGNGNWAVKDGYALAYNDENNNFKPLPFTFTRSSIATRVNKQGLIETVGKNKPRIDFTDNTSGHLLLEPSRTNLVTDSEDFSDSSYYKNNATITTDDATSPDGNVTADKITALDLSEVLLLNSEKIVKKQPMLSNADLKYQEDRRKRKVRKLDFEER